MDSLPKKNVLASNVAKALGVIAKGAQSLQSKADDLSKPVEENEVIQYKKISKQNHLETGRILLIDRWMKKFESHQIKNATRIIPMLLLGMILTLLISFLASPFFVKGNMSSFETYCQMWKVTTASLLSKVWLGKIVLSINLGEDGTVKASASQIASQLGFIAIPVYTSAVLAIIPSFFASKLFMLWFEKLAIETSKDVQESKFIKGAMLVEPEQLNKIITERFEESKSKPWFKEPIFRLKLGDVELPPDAETEGIFISGATGAGKTVCQKDICRQVRAAGFKMILNDPAPEFIETMYQEGDVVFSPYDERYLNNWDLWNELKSSYDAKNFSIALVSIPEKADWIGNKGRMVLEGLIMVTTSFEELNELLRSDYTTIKQRLIGTAGEGLIQDDFKSAESSGRIIGHLITSLDLFRMLKSPAPGVKRLSIREWVADNNDRRWIFLINRSDQCAILGPLYTLIFDMICMELLTLKPNTKLKREDQRRIFMNLEELPTSLPPIPSLLKMTSQGRKYGLGIIVTAQTKNQFESKTLYGKEDTISLIQNLKTWCIYQMTVKDTAEFISEQIGTYEEEQTSLSIKAGPEEDDHGGLGWTTRIAERKTILTSEVQRLPKLQCLLMCSDLPVTKVTIGIATDYVEPVEAFIPSERMKLVHPRLEAKRAFEASVLAQQFPDLSTDTVVEPAFSVEDSSPPLNHQSPLIRSSSNDPIDLDQIFGSETQTDTTGDAVIEVASPSFAPPIKTPAHDESWRDALKL